VKISRQRFIWLVISFICSLPILFFNCAKSITAHDDEDGLPLARRDVIPTSNIYSVADFIAQYSTVYETDWDELPGSWLLVSFRHFGLGNYKYYINGVLCLQAINKVRFDFQRHALQITKNNRIVFNHSPLSPSYEP